MHTRKGKFAVDRKITPLPALDVTFDIPSGAPKTILNNNLSNNNLSNNNPIQVVLV